MTPNIWLAIFILCFWVLLWLLVKLDLLLHRRPLSDGPSFIPVVPIVPAAAFGVGWLTNKFLPPYGTVIVAAVHLAVLAGAIVRLRKTRN